MFEDIESIAVECDGAIRRIVLARGDLARIDPTQGVDMLVVSAFPGDYTPTPTSLIGQLTAQGVPVRRLALFPERDLRQSMGAWLSHPVEGAGFRRLVGFEPDWVGEPPNVVGQLFRALFPFLEGQQDQVVAMPVLSTGDAGWSAQAMMPPLLEAAVEWLKLGLPVDTLYVVSRREQDLVELAAIFRARAAILNANGRDEVTVALEPVLALPTPVGPAPDIARRAAPRAEKAASGWGFRIAVTAGLLVTFAVAVVYWMGTLGAGAPPGTGAIGAGTSFAYVAIALLGSTALVALFRLWRRSPPPERAEDPGGAKPGGAAVQTKAPEVDRPGPAPQETKRIFLSFSSHDAEVASLVRTTLEAAPMPIEVFDFRRDIPIGVSYQREIDAAMKEAHRVLCLVSPDYLASPECEEEFMVARLRNKRKGFAYLAPFYWRGVEGDLEDWIMILSPADCREADEAKLHAALGELRDALVA